MKLRIPCTNLTLPDGTADLLLVLFGITVYQYSRPNANEQLSLPTCGFMTIFFMVFKPAMMEFGHGLFQSFKQYRQTQIHIAQTSATQSTSQPGSNQ